MIPLSIFDVDRTLTRLPTYSAFLLFAARRLAPWRLALLPVLAPTAAGYALKLVDRRQMKETMHRLMLGRRLPCARARAIATAFVDQLVENGLYREGQALIARERAAGRRIVLATAAPELYVRSLAERLGVEDVIATAGTWRAGCLTPAIDGLNCYGAAKQAMLATWLAGNGLSRETCHMRFYSDHASDLPTFEWVDEPVAVNPSRRLYAIARERGWPAVDWRAR
ncbi:MAG: HAD-IB family hydrolase [Sphingomonadaceae bacterium]